MSNMEAQAQNSFAIPRTPSPSNGDGATLADRDAAIAQLSFVNPRTPLHSLISDEDSLEADDTVRPRLSPYRSLFSSRHGAVTSVEGDPTNAHPSSVISRPSAQFFAVDDDKCSSVDNDANMTQLSPYRSSFDNTHSVPSTERGSTHVQPFSVFSRPYAHLPVMDEGSSEPDDTPYSSQFKTRDAFIDDVMARNGFVIPEPPVYPSRDGERTLSRTDWVLRETIREGLELRLRPCWVDQDASGDYDPNCEFSEPRTLPSCPKRPRLVRPGDEIGTPQPKKPKVYTWQTGRKEGLSLPIVIKVKSDLGKALLAAFNWQPDNWPEKKPRGTAELPNFTELHLDSIQPQRLRQRNRSRVNSNLLQEEETELSSLADVTLGYPAARGCKNCFEINLPCSLLTEGEKYPCRDCKQDDVDCELIVQPLKKRACESCRRRKIVCSYRTTEDHSQPCRDCLLSGCMCVAGPLTGRTRTGPCLDSGTKRFIPTPERPYKSCTACRKVKKRCSLESNDGYGYHSCTRCEGLGQTCTFKPIHQRDRKTLPERQPKDVETPQDIYIPTAGLTMTIKTGFAHPISFSHDPPADGSAPCHWCENLTYGILGLPQRRVEVIDYQSGEGYVEINGGHTADGVPPSRMCNVCTFARMKILGCSAHDIQPIIKEIPDTLDIMQWMDPDMMADAPFEWCSVCPRPASYECGNTSPADMRLSDDSVVGCGLKLCEDCALGLVNEHGGDLTEYLRALEENDDNFTLRADAYFLRSDGHLLSRICT